MARKCTLKTCRSELPSRASSDVWQAKGYCDLECMIEHGSIKGKEALERKRKTDELGIKKRNLEFKKLVKQNDKSFRAAQAQKAFNAYIRQRDEKEPCISCQRHHKGQYHAGHYRTVGAAKQLRFDEDNCHKQCAPCNNHLSGNLTEYRINLIKKIGLKAVELLDNNNEVKRYSIEEYKTIEQHYKAKLKELLAK